MDTSGEIMGGEAEKVNSAASDAREAEKKRSKGTIIKRWVPATDADFVVVRDTAKVLNLDLRKMK